MTTQIPEELVKTHSRLPNGHRSTRNPGKTEINLVELDINKFIFKHTSSQEAIATDFAQRGISAEQPEGSNRFQAEHEQIKIASQVSDPPGR